MNLKETQCELGEDKDEHSQAHKKNAKEDQQNKE